MRGSKAGTVGAGGPASKELVSVVPPLSLRDLAVCKPFLTCQLTAAPCGGGTALPGVRGATNLATNAAVVARP